MNSNSLIEHFFEVNFFIFKYFFKNINPALQAAFKKNKVKSRTDFRKD